MSFKNFCAYVNGGGGEHVDIQAIVVKVNLHYRIVRSFTSFYNVHVYLIVFYF
jgi:hypothetical protein